MTRRLFTPPEKIIIGGSTPLIFLEGPVQGAEDWQSSVAEVLLRRRSDVVIASPRRTVNDQLKFDADEQVKWEHASIKRARQFGAIGIWFAAKNLNDMSYPSHRAYAQTTRIELGDAIASKRADLSLPVVVGFDQQYKENGGGSENYIRRILQLEGLPAPRNTLNEFIADLIEQTPKLER